MDINNNYFEKITKSNVNLSPYPHLVVDNFLEKDLILKIKNLWPNNFLHNDLRGSNCFYFSSELKKQTEEEQTFWKNFLTNDIHQIAEILLKKFITFVSYKMISEKIEWGTGYSQENFSKKKSLDFSPHVHFDHDPLWILTFLIYINDEYKNAPGTSLHSVGESKEERIQNFLKWNDIWHDDNMEYGKKIEKINELELKNIKNIDFIENRLFCFVDGPFSFHSVNYNESQEQINRHSLRFALGVERNKISSLYNVEPENWIKVFDGNSHNLIKFILDKEHDSFYKTDKTLPSNTNFQLGDFPFF